MESLLTICQLTAEHHGFGAGDVGTVHQSLQSQVEVDESCLHSDLCHAQPEPHVLRAVLHEQSDHVALLEAPLKQKVSHAVGVVVKLLKAPFLARSFKNQSRLVPVFLDRLGKKFGNGVVLSEVLFDIQFYPQQHAGCTAKEHIYDIRIMMASSGQIL